MMSRPDTASARRDRIDAAERRSLLLGVVFRAVGTPAVGLLGLANTAIVVHHTDARVFGVVSTVAAIALLFPFADLGIGAIVTTATTQWAEGALSREQFRRTLIRAAVVLTMVTLTIWVLAAAAVLGGAWSRLFNASIHRADGVALSLAVAVFGLAVPLGVGIRILTGLGKNHVAVAITLTSAGFTLAGTLALAATGAHGLLFAVPPVAGLALSGFVAAAVAVSMISRNTPPAFGANSSIGDSGRLLAGSGSMFVIAIGLPIGLQWGRLVVAHDGDTTQLASYSLAAQFYGMAWMLVSTAGAALWPMFVRRRGDRERTMQLWRSGLVSFILTGAVLGAGFAVVAPWFGRTLTDGRIDISYQLAGAYAALLIVQSAHLPTGSLLTLPGELRWQACCVVVMATASVALAVALVPVLGATGAVIAAAVGVLVGQVVPDILYARRIVSARNPLRERVV